MSIFHTLFSNKEITLLAKQEINNQTCKTVRINMNSKVNIPQSQVSSSNIMWQEFRSRTMQETFTKILKIHKSKEKN